MPNADTVLAPGQPGLLVHRTAVQLSLRDGIIMLACLVLVTLTLVIDLAIPLGIAVGVLYVVPTLISLSSERRSITLGVAAVGTLLTIVDYVVSPIAGVAPWMVIANRFLSILAIWVTTVLCLRQKERSRQAERLRVKNEFLARESLAAGKSLALVSRQKRELEEALANLHASQATALHMMHDAQASRRKAEEAEAKQRQLAEDLGQAYRTLESQVIERERAAVELRKLFHAVEQCSVSVVITDATGRMEYVNPKFTELTGYTVQEAVGKNTRIYSSGQTPKATIKQLWETILSGQKWQGELLNKKKSGELYWEFVSISPITDSDGKITHFVSVKEDITERRQVDAALRNSEARHRTLFDASADAIMLLNEGGFLDCNPATLCLFGLSHKTEFIGLHPSDLSPPQQADGTDSREAANERIASVLREGNAKFEWLHRRSDGQDFFAEVWLTALELGDERVVQATVRDISARKRAEARLAELHDELVKASRQAGKAEIATNVLHNVGNVLNSVNVSAGVIQETLRASEVPSLNNAIDIMEQRLGDLGDFVTQDKRGKHLPRFLIEVGRQMATQETTILEQVNSLIRSIDHIKSIVVTQQSNAGRVSAIIEEVTLAELLEDAVRINAASMQRHSVQIMRRFEDIATVRLDKQKLLQIIVNLIRNAKHACEESGKESKQVTLGLRRTGEDRVLIEVRDNGVGIPAENLTRIFAHGFTTRKDGHGFGLHSAALAAEELDGRLTAFSDGPGQGAVFTLELPTGVKEDVSCHA